MVPPDSLTSFTRRLDGPTIAFEHQPTLSVPVQTFAREASDRSTSSTLRPFVGPSSHEVTTTTTTTKRTGRLVWLCTLCLGVGLVAGHLAREGSRYAASVSIAVAGVLGTAGRATREVRAADIVSARATEAAARSKAATATPEGSRGARGVVGRSQRRAPAPAASAPTLSPLDALFVDFEPAFRAPR